MKLKFLFLLALFFNPLWGQIIDPVKHANNKVILETILQEELTRCPTHSPEGKARFLRGRITEIASALLQRGFSSEAYGIPPRSFDYSVLWEGGKNQGLPITFFIYVWPTDGASATDIHSHPIPCAFSVLHGVCAENIYELLENRQVRCIQHKRFAVGQGEVDDGEGGFIHQLYGESSPSKTCLSLHAYGLPSEKEVMECFQTSSAECSYYELK